jgi:hypothetical protein
MLTDTSLEELDELRQRWDHEIHPLRDQNRTDQELP